MRTLCVTTAVVLLSLPNARAVAVQPAPNASVCALFSVEDAAKIMGGAMTPKPDRGATVCMYQLKGDAYGTAALTLVRSSDRAAEDRAWASIKDIRHLQAGSKNTRAVLSVGDEAWFDGSLKN